MKKFLLPGLAVIMAVIYLSTVFQPNSELHTHQQEPNVMVSIPDALSPPTSKEKRNMLTPNQIIKKHQPSFEKLQAKATQRINKIVVLATEEYEYESASPFYLLNKYLPRLQQLEKQIDKDFDALYRSLQTELETNGHSPQKAASIKKTYEESKQKTKQIMTEKMMKKLTE